MFSDEVRWKGEEDTDKDEDEEDEEEDEEEEVEMDEEDDDNEGWEDVESGSEVDEDEDEEEADEVDEKEEEGQAAAASDVAPVSPGPPSTRYRVDARRILTSEDFALIERLREAQADRAKDPRFRTKGALAKTAEARKRQREEDEEEAPAGSNMSFAVEASSLGPGMKTGKTSKIDRITHILEGRKESKFEHEGHAGGLTNKEKLRKKNFVMVRKGKASVAKKVNKSNSDQRYEKMHQVRLIRSRHHRTHACNKSHPNILFFICRNMRIVSYTFFSHLNNRKSSSAATEGSEEERNDLSEKDNLYVSYLCIILIIRYLVPRNTIQWIQKKLVSHEAFILVI
jgi:hypothetical protein